MLCRGEHRMVEVSRHQTQWTKSPFPGEIVMEPDREALRDELLAMLHAAPELPQEDRASLADVFLDKLQAGYEVIPRTRPESVRTAHRQPGPVMFPGWAGAAAGFAAFLFLASA